MPKSDDIIYPDKSDILAIHEDIINEDQDASAGILNEGDIDYATQFIEHGHFGQVPESIHEKAFSLMRLLAANHAFADGNKRTALNSTWTFYLLNGYYFDYGEEIKAILKMLAVMENMIDKDEAVDYFSEITSEVDKIEGDSKMVELSHIIYWSNNFIERYDTVKATIENDGRVDKKQILTVLEEANQLVTRMEEYAETYSPNLPEDYFEALSAFKEWNDEIADGVVEALEGEEYNIEENDENSE